MSTIPYGPNDEYLIGTIGTEYFKSEGFFSFFKDIATNMGNVKDVGVPTTVYGPAGVMQAAHDRPAIQKLTGANLPA